MRGLVVSVLIWACALPAAVAGELDGRYERAVSVRNLEDGTRASMTDFLEIESRGASALFFVYESWHTNGHTCRLWGTARRVASGVHEHVPETGAWPGEPVCRVHVYGQDGQVVVEDVGGHCRASACGARGAIGKDPFPMSRRVPLQRAVRVPW